MRHIRALVGVSLWMVWWAGAFAASAWAQTHPNDAKGISASASLTFGPDTISLWAGSRVVTIAIGQSYPVSERFSYGLTLVLQNDPWIRNDFTDPFGTTTIQSLPDPANVAGLGWRVSLGRFDPPSLPSEGDIDHAQQAPHNYQMPDGSIHGLYATLHEGESSNAGVFYSRDGSSIRLNVSRVEFPDGSSHTVGSGGYPTSMQDAHGSTVTIRYLDGNGNATNPNQALQWELKDPHNRTQRVFFKATSPPYLANQPRLVDRIELSAFGGQTAIYRFRYNIDVPGHQVITMTGCDNTNGQTQNVSVALLTSLELPNGTSYQVPVTSYETAAPAPGAPCTTGMLKRIKTPLLATIEWDFITYRFHAGSSIRAFRQRATGVGTRRLLDAAGNVVGNPWSFDPQPSPSFSEVVTTITDPELNQWRHYFSSCPSQCIPADRAFDYALPFSRDAGRGDGAGHFLSVEVVPAGQTSPVRSLYLTYEKDNANLTPDLQYNTRHNQRLSAQRVVYEDGTYAEETSSEFEGFHYRRKTTGGNFPGSGPAAGKNVKTYVTSYNPTSGTYGTPTYVPWPWTKQWMLEYFESTQVEQQLDSGLQVLYQGVCVDPATGFVKGRRIHSQNGAGFSTNDAVEVFAADAAGNLTSESYFGGNLQAITTDPTAGKICNLVSSLTNPAYRINHTPSFGVRATSQYTGTTFFTLERAIDAGTGLPSSTKDPAGLETTIDYDTSGRPKTVTPPDDEASTTYTYRNAMSASSLARVTVSKLGAGGNTPTTRTTSDAFGRPTFDEKKMADGTFSSRTTRYNALGWKTSASELGTGAFGTTYSEFDSFGRPKTIVPADGNDHKIELSYSGDREVTRKVKVATAADGSESLATTKERYDRFGRLFEVEESNGVLTRYTYDAADRLIQVCQKNPDSSCGQTRKLTYDNRGFLTSEQHPELGSVGNGTVTYGGFDARGHATTRNDGVHVLSFSFDSAERLWKVSEGANTLKQLTFAAANAGANFQKGKLVAASRFHYATALGNVEVKETNTYAGRGGRLSGRATQWTANGTAGEGFSTSWTYDDLGNVGVLTYPKCSTGSCLNQDTSHTLTSTYANGWLTGLTGNGTVNYASAITYHSNGMVHRIPHGNGVVDTIARDPSFLPRPASYSTSGAISNWSSGTYAYDGAGNVKRTGGSYYVYDLLSRVVDGHVFDGPTGAGTLRFQTYQYDDFGNLNSIGGDPVAGGRTTQTSAFTNRLNGATYDPAGNLLVWNQNTYDHDAFGLVSRYVGAPPNGEDWRFFYTASDERLRAYRVGGSGSRWTLRDADGKVLREYDAHVSWGSFEDTIYRDGQLLATSQPGVGVRHMHIDHLGTPRLTTGSVSTVVPGFYTLTPCRVVDTRNPGQSALVAGETRIVPMAGSCGIPSGASAVSVNLTSVLPTAQGGLTAFPANEARPVASAISYTPSSVRANNGVLKLGGDALAFYCNQPSGSVHLIVDVNGYFLESGATGAQTVAYHAYFPFGEEITSPTQDVERKKFTGHERDFANPSGVADDLDYMLSRHYSPLLGRFLSVDPSQLSRDPARPQSWNRYVYASNNPFNRIDPNGLVDFYVTTTFKPDQFSDPRVTDYLQSEAVNFDRSRGTATSTNFQRGLDDTDGVSIYFGHSDTKQSLFFNDGGFKPFAEFTVKNSIVALATCNSTEIIKNFPVGSNQALIGVTSNQENGFVKAGDLSFITTQLIARLRAGESVGKVVDYLNKFFTKRAQKNPKYSVSVVLKGNSKIIVK